MSPKPTRNKIGEYLEFATGLAEEAGRITLKYFRQGAAVETKADQTPVTIADRETEQFLRDEIEGQYKEHGILGEEFGEHNTGARWRWIVDPIDGTQAFVQGLPLYTVLIALECNGEPHLGVIHNPVLGETVAAATGLGCRLNGEPCHVSDTADLGEAWIQTTDYAELTRRRPKLAAGLLGAGKWARTWADGYGYLLLATGRADVALDPIVNLWDVAPVKPIIEEAGGRFSDLDGHASIHNETALATNGKLHDQVLELARLDR